MKATTQAAAILGGILSASQVRTLETENLALCDVSLGGIQGSVLCFVPNRTRIQIIRDSTEFFTE